MAKIIRPTKEIRDKAITKAVERILSSTERPTSENINIEVDLMGGVTISYRIKETIIPEEEFEERQQAHFESWDNIGKKPSIPEDAEEDET